MCVLLVIFILVRVICCKFVEPAWFWLNFLAMPRLCNIILKEKILKEKKNIIKLVIVQDNGNYKIDNKQFTEIV